jgi:hypothetical protein
MHRAGVERRRSAAVLGEDGGVVFGARRIFAVLL